jgi:hypothetical protein
MDDHPNSPQRKTSLPTFTSSIPVEIAALPASTRTSFTRVDNNTRPGTAAGDNNDMCDEGAVPNGGGGGSSSSGGGGGGGGTPAPAPTLPEGGEPEGVVSAVEAEATATVVVPQVPQTLVQFLLVSGRRRSMAFVPETTIGRVKELAWNSWPNGASATFLPSLPPCTSHHEPTSPITLARCHRKGPARASSFLFFSSPHFNF